HLGAGALCGDHLLRDPTDGPDRSVERDGPGPGDGSTTGEVTRNEEVGQAERPHETRGGSTDPVAVEGHREGKVLDQVHADDRVAHRRDLDRGDGDVLGLAAGEDGETNVMAHAGRADGL